MNRKKLKIVSIAGARPQFIKLAALSRVLSRNFNEIILHTGQHYNDEMSDLFFRQLKIKKPLYNLGIKSGYQGQQTGKMMEGIERVLLKERPGLVLVYGDTNSTLAGALAAAKLSIPIAHIEAGLRSYNRSMPEEINRVLTDHLSGLLFCPTDTAVNNLKKEGIVRNVHNVGDVMYDAVLYYLGQAKKSSSILDKLDIEDTPYYLATVHRAENTDSKEKLKKIMDILSSLHKKVILPLHPRTRKALEDFRINRPSPNLRLIEPLSYFDMLILEQNAKIILTDSGGVQKEAFFLKVPCVTLRRETEWVETVAYKRNIVTGISKNKVIRAVNLFLKLHSYPHVKDPYGDGDSAVKMVQIITRLSFIR